MNVVDSSGWLEYFGNSANAGFFAEPLADPETLIVPAISIFEGFKRVLQQRDEASALQAAAPMPGLASASRVIAPPSFGVEYTTPESLNPRSPTRRRVGVCSS